MVLSNLKIYSTSLYGWQLSVKAPYNELVELNTKNLIDDPYIYNQMYFLTRKAIYDKIFVMYDGGYTKELLTGIPLPCERSEFSSSKELAMIRSMKPFYILENDLHEEIDTIQIENYLKMFNSKKDIQEVLEEEKNNFNLMTDFYEKQTMYKIENEEKLIALAKRIKENWRKN